MGGDDEGGVRPAARVGAGALSIQPGGFAQRVVDARLPAFAIGTEEGEHVGIEAHRHKFLVATKRGADPTMPPRA